MPPEPNKPIHLVSRWNVLPGQQSVVSAALQQLTADVYATEPDTLLYNVHMPKPPDPEFASLPTPSPTEVVFYECYSSVAAFRKHVHGTVFTDFVKRYGALFVCPSGTPGQPLMLVEFLELKHGFVRPGAGHADGQLVQHGGPSTPPSAAGVELNRHPHQSTQNASRPVQR